MTFAASAQASTTPLDVALPYNYFVLGNFSATPDITGRIAVGGTLTSSSLTVGSDIPNGSDPYSLAQAPISFYANTVNGGSYNINKGNVYVGSGSANFNFNGGGSKLATCAPKCIDFVAAATNLKDYSTQLGTLASNGTVGGVIDPTNPSFTPLRGTSNTLNVFNLTAAQFQSSSLDLIISNPSATTLINVVGNVSNSGGALTFNGTQASGTQSAGAKVIFNFTTATSVAIGNQFSASILAPRANYAGSAQVDGNVIVGSVSASGETHDALFTGAANLPPATTATPEPSTAYFLMGGGFAAAAYRRFRSRT